MFRQRNALGRWSAFASFKLVGLLQRVVRPLSLPAVLIFALALVSARAPAADLHTLEIVSKTGVHVFSIELAVSDEDRARGLMFRRELPDGQGMLFDFGRDQDVVVRCSDVVDEVGNVKTAPPLKSTLKSRPRTSSATMLMTRIAPEIAYHRRCLPTKLIDTSPR